MRHVLLITVALTLGSFMLIAQTKNPSSKQAPPKYAPPAAPQGPPKPPSDLNQQYRKVGAPVAPIALEKPNGSIFTNAQLKKGKAVWLMIFSPQCDHCEHVIDSLKRMSSQLKDVQLVLVAEPRNKEFLGAFIKKTGIGSDPMFQQIGVDKGNLIYNIYNYQILPQLNIYGSSQKLEKTFFGNWMIDSVKTYLH